MTQEKYVWIIENRGENIYAFSSRIKALAWMELNYKNELNYEETINGKEFYLWTGDNESILLVKLRVY